MRCSDDGVEEDEMDEGEEEVKDDGLKRRELWMGMIDSLMYLLRSAC